jgi:signal transduction histidine kinase
MILYNLISNALKYYDQNKNKPYVKIVIHVSGKVAEIRVIDNGPGMDKTHLENVFTMYYKGAQSSNGTGLGLYIVREAVDKLKGTITVDSKLGEGSVFTVVIPSHEEKIAYHQNDDKEDGD